MSITSWSDIAQDLLELSKQDGVERTTDLELLEALRHTDLVVIGCDMDFWNDGTDGYNSYNWNGPVVFEIKKLTDHIAGISFHRAGDVRGNYSDPVYIAGTVEDIITTISELSIDRHINGWHISQGYLDEDGYINAWHNDTDEDYSGHINNAPEDLQDAYNATDLA